MTLTISDVVTHYILSSHPKNKAIIDIKEKTSGELRYIKIRHRLSKFYAISLVDPVSFEVWAETQVKSASAKNKPIVLHVSKDNKSSIDQKVDTSVEFREGSRITFEWVFSWEGETYKWVRESRMSNILECKAIRKTGDICVAQYLPRMLKDEYFGIFSLLGYNMLRCKLTNSRELELIILTSLMTLLDKSNDGGWKKDQVSLGLQGDSLEDYRRNTNVPSSKQDDDDIVSPIAYEDPIPKKELQKKYRTELLNDQKLQFLLEKDVKRSQKQIRLDQKSSQTSISAGNSPSTTPKTSPLPTPSSSTQANHLSVLTRQKSTSALNSLKPSQTGSIYSEQTCSVVLKSNKNGRLARLFNTLSHNKTNYEPVVASDIVESPVSSLPPTDSRLTHSKKDALKMHSAPSEFDGTDRKDLTKINRQIQVQNETYYDHHLSLPTHYSAAQLCKDFSKVSINSYKYDNPPSVRSIRWNHDSASSNSSSPKTIQNMYGSQNSPHTSQNQPHYGIARNNNSSRRPHLDDRRISATEYSLYTYRPNHAQNYDYSYDNQNSYSPEYYIHPYEQPHQFDYY